MTRFRTGNIFLGVVVVVAIIVRVLGLNQPFIDPWSWRQSDVAAIARNYFEGGFHFAYPQIDWSGTAKGFVGTEFPILPFIGAISYIATGVREWVGRLQSLVFFAFALPFFYRLVKQIFGSPAAGWALVFYCFAPVSIMTSRCFMPDMPSLSLSIIGLYYFLRWAETERRTFFVVSALSVALAILIKIPSAVIGAPLACIAFQRFGIGAMRRPAMWLFGLIVLLPSAVWYLHALDVAHRYPPHHFFGDGGLRLMPLSWYVGILVRMLRSTITVAPILLAAAVVLVKRNVIVLGARVFDWWLAAMILFVVVIGYGNRHPWYQLPLVPILSAFAGAAMAVISTTWLRSVIGRAAVVSAVMLVFALQSYRAMIELERPAAADLRSLGLALEQRTAPGDLIVIADYGDPTGLYYAKRKGWHFTERAAMYNGHPNTSADAVADLEHLRAAGATHIAFYSGSAWWLDYYTEFNDYLRRTSEVIESNDQYQIFKLKRDLPSAAIASPDSPAGRYRQNATGHEVIFRLIQTCGDQLPALE